MWHENALNKLQNVELIFADPNNGIIGSKIVREHYLKRAAKIGRFESY